MILQNISSLALMAESETAVSETSRLSVAIRQVHKLRVIALNNVKSQMHNSNCSLVIKNFKCSYVKPNRRVKYILATLQ